MHDAVLHDGVPNMSRTGLIDRERELDALESAAARRSGQLVIVSGRRRVGKTYTATQQSAPVELAAFTDTVRACAQRQVILRWAAGGPTRAYRSCYLCPTRGRITG